MTNEYNLKEGDKVMLADDANAIGVIRFVGKESCIIDFGLGDSTTDYKDIVPLDRRTAFLTRLQSLMREFDAEICYREGDCELHIDLGNGNTFDRISYMFEYKGYDVGNEDYLNLTADNIMDFERE